MNLTQLRIFKVVAELENISKAANSLYIAQPSISRTISSLEKELELPLFDRKGRNIFLNKNGYILLKYTNEILHSFDSLKFELNEANFNSMSQLPINFYAASPLIPYLTRKLYEQYPNLNFQTYRQPALEFERGNRGRLAIHADTKERIADSSTLLLKEKILAIIPRSNPLSQKQKLTLSDLENEKIIGFTKERSLRLNMDYYFNLVGIQPTYHIECTEPSAILELLRSGIDMITFLPECSWGEITLPENLVVKTISNPECFRYLYMTHGQGMNKKGSSIQIIESIIMDYFKNTTPLSDSH